MAKEDHEDFNNSTTCWICEKSFKNFDVKVKDHVHINGKYGNAAHLDCKLNLTLTKKLCIVFHNIQNYDSNLIFQEVGK